jgi:UDP:flavonoid glycosyltransferase YjiC (YdhE family)
MPVKSIAYFISSHGFGHAARAAAVMQVIAEYDSSVQFEIFTATPSWFFQDSLSTHFNYHHLLTDFGLAQKMPFQIRQRLGLLTDRNVVLITIGGIPQSYDFLQKLKKLQEIKFVMPGAGPEIKIRDNLIILPHQSDFYHPDLVNACDAVIGKVGYSTLAEVYHAGVPFGYVARSN